MSAPAAASAAASARLSGEPRLLGRLAAFNVVVHGAGLALMVTGIRAGCPVVELSERMAYLAARPWGWMVGWGVWMLCAVALVAFLGALSHALRVSHGAELLRMAFVVATAGSAIDLLCDAIYITVLPRIAAGGPASAPLFLAAERMAGAGGLIVANGLYSAAILLASVALRAARPAARAAFVLGAAVSALGGLMVAAGFSGSSWFAGIASVPTIGLYCVWVVVVARAVSAPAGGLP